MRNKIPLRVLGSVCAMAAVIGIVMFIWPARDPAKMQGLGSRDAVSVAAGDLDPSFGSGGKETVDFPGPNLLSDVALQADGKLVAAGYGELCDCILLARYNTNGTLDSSFGTGGLVRNAMSAPSAVSTGTTINSVVIQSDGKIVVGGGTINAGTGDSDFRLARYTTNGTLDSTFGAGGIVNTDIGGGTFDSAGGLALQSDGKIVAAGGTGPATAFDTADFAIVRYNSNGTLDTSFDGDGKVITDLGSAFDRANAVRIQTDGKIIAAGSTSNASSSAIFGLARYNTNGSLDTTFDGDGKVTSDFGSTTANSAITNIAIQSDGKIVAAGSSIARYLTNGGLDPAFGTGGRITPTGLGTATDVGLQADGRIVAVGQTGTNTAIDFAAARYLTDGQPDTTFDGDGRLSTDFMGGRDQARAVIIQPDGRIVVGGITGQPWHQTFFDTSRNRPFGLVRYNTDGSLDNGFGTAGKATTSFLVGYDSATGIVLQPDGKMLVVGENFRGFRNNLGAALISTDDFRLSRYNVDGTLDQAFGTGGRVWTDIGFEDESTTVALQPDGKILVGGGTLHPRTGGADFNDFALVRYNSDGSLDTTFGSGGIALNNLGVGDFITAIVLQPDGKIVAAGGFSAFIVARFNTNGTLDTSFGTNGSVSLDFGTGTSPNAKGLLLQPDGKFIVLGTATVSTQPRFALMRLLSNGTLDTSFGSGGRVSTDPGVAYAGVLQPTGKIVVAGTNTNTSPADFSLRRYNADGSLDTTFGTGGTTLTDFAGGDDAALALVQQLDGKLVAGGYKNLLAQPGNDFALARYSSNGVLDTTFGTGGKVTTDFGSDQEGVQGMAVQTNGRLVAVGFAATLTGDHALARYITDAAPTPTPSPTPQGNFEGDINNPTANVPVGTGDGDVTIADVIVYGRVARGELCPGSSNPNFQQKLDAGPRATMGDGLFGSSDGAAIDAFSRHDASTDFDPSTVGWQPTPAAGPLLITNLQCARPADDLVGFIESGIDDPPRTMRLIPVRTVSRGPAALSRKANEVVFDVEIDAAGNEAGTQFSIHWDPAIATLSGISGVDANPDVTRGDDAPWSSRLNVNGENVANGDLGIVANFAAAGDMTLDTGRRRVVRLTFHLKTKARAGALGVTLTDDIVRRQTVDAWGRILQ